MNIPTFPIHVFVFPSANKNNRYIDLFKQSILDANREALIHECKNDDIGNMFSILKSYDWKRSKNIIHIHWPTILYGSKYVLKSLYLLKRNFILLFVLKHFYKVKIVWTVHNLHAHDYPHPWIDRLGSFIVKHFADAVVCQQKSTCGRLSVDAHSKQKVVYIPHGNFIDAYGEYVERDRTLRTSLGFSEDDLVLLSFGAIAPYKENKKIIEIFKKACAAHRTGDRNLKLLIVGKGSPAHVAKLTACAQGDANIVIRNSFIPTLDVSKYLSIADYSVFYYDDSEMTSGGMILSLSYGLPVITRDIPAAESVTDVTGVVFKTNEELLSIFVGLQENGSRAYDRRAIIDSVASIGWDRVGSDLIALYVAL